LIKPCIGKSKRRRLAPLRWLCAMLLLMTGAGANAAAPMRFERLGISEGLSQQSVNVILQDPAGFLWLGTEDGLNRYDGYGIEHIRQSRAETDGLGDNFIVDAKMDGYGRIWVATAAGGLARQDEQGQKFKAVSAAAGVQNIRTIRFDAQGTLWIGTRDGLASFDPERKVLARWRHDPTNADSLVEGAVHALLADSQRYMWVGADGGLDRLDLKTQTIEHIALQGASADRRVQVRSLFEDHLGGIWIGTDTGVIVFDARDGSQHVYRHDAEAGSLPANTVNTIFEDRAGRVWLGTSDGLALYNRQTQSFDVYRNDASDSLSLPDDEVMSIFEDRGGLLWIGTRSGGAGKWNPRTWAFGHHTPHIDATAFTEDRVGRLWIGTADHGLMIADRSRDTLTPGYREHEPLGERHIAALLTDHLGFIWAGALQGGLIRIDPQTRAVTSYEREISFGVLALLEDSAHRLWIGTEGAGLSKLDIPSGQFQRYLADERITALAQDQAGRIWIGTNGAGAAILDPSTDRLYRFQRDPGDATSLSSDVIYAVHVDAAGHVWLGTRGGGLERVVGESTHPGSIRFTNLTTQQGLPNNTIYGIRSDARGALWLATSYGLAHYDPNTGGVRAYHARNGLQGEEFTRGAHYRNRRDELFFGGTNGFNAFDPSQIDWSYGTPPVALTAVREGDGHADLREVSASPLRLEYKRNVITFEFAALDFANPHANRFQYKLQDFQPDWVDAGAERRVSYSNLPGGDYIFRVRAANADGAWNQQGASFAFSVSPAPWLTWKAYTLYFVLLAAIGIATLLIHRQRIIREEIYKRRLETDVLNRTRDLATRNAELESANERLEQASLSDPLTGLGNRRSLGEAMPSFVSRVKPKAETPDSEHMILMLIDLDRLKPINDEFGHEAGDRLLGGVSSILLDCVRSTDKVVRWGGDEFVIVSAPLGFDGGAALAERIRATVARRRFSISNSQLARTSCSIGFACYPFVADDPYLLSWEQTLKIADMALYRAKARRNTWIGWSGTRNAVGISDLPSLIAANPVAAANGGLIDVRTCAATNDETIEALLSRRVS
jgi:diguanylate cyclase (GGDEF)-like protein